jgi:hypothetical protein
MNLTSDDADIHLLRAKIRGDCHEVILFLRLYGLQLRNRAASIKAKVV